MSETPSVRESITALLALRPTWHADDLARAVNACTDLPVVTRDICAYVEGCPDARMRAGSVVLRVDPPDDGLTEVEIHGCRNAEGTDWIFMGWPDIEGQDSAAETAANNFDHPVAQRFVARLRVPLQPIKPAVVDGTVEGTDV